MGLLKKLMGQKKSLVDDRGMIYSPITGDVKPLSEVNDPVFAEEMMGKGVAIVPAVGQVLAPMDGEVISVFRTRHAVTMRLDSGAEVIIHVGLNTVELGGENYNAHVEDGTHVKKGDLLLTFDLEKIKALGYDLITPIVVMNWADLDKVECVAVGEVKNGAPLLQLK